MAERLKAHAWKVCKGATLSWVRIPFSPPKNLINKSIRIPGIAVGLKLL